MGAYKSHMNKLQLPQNVTSENKCTKLHDQSPKHKHVLWSSGDGHNTATKCCEAAHEGVLATGRGPLTNCVTSFPTLQQFPGFLAILEQHLYIGKDFFQAFLRFSLENTEQSKKQNTVSAKKAYSCIVLLKYILFPNRHSFSPT